MNLVPVPVRIPLRCQQPCSRGLAAIGCTALLLAANCSMRPDVVARQRNDSTEGGLGESVAAVDAGNSSQPSAESGAPNPVQALELSGDLQTHDSSIIEVDGSYYLFHSGEGIPIKASD